MKVLKRAKRALKAFTSSSEEMTLGQLIEFLNIKGVERDALSEATYFACMKVLSESIGKLPLKLQQFNDENGVTTARHHPLYRIIKERPNPYMTATTFWSTIELNRNHEGNAYALITGAGKTTNLWILPSKDVKVWYDDAKIISDVPDIYYIYYKNDKKYVFSSEQILHFKASNTYDGISGVSVRDQLNTTIQGNIKAQSLVNKMYESGFTAKAAMQYTGSLSDENVKTFVAGIESYAKGELADEGIENIIPIPLGATLTPLNIKLADNQFIEVKQYSALQI
ncbi:phage portal protein, partial [Cetobacterium sp.]|uniref:phage portal protein n=1 Tax=Cetobacterium sp. TaxID=2071632 RepID=UPI003F37DEA9